ncbi:MAG: Tn3 family transposase [Pseudonocardiaceae bacterium]
MTSRNVTVGTWWHVPYRHDTTKYIDAAVAQLQAESHEIHGEDIARLSPLKDRNLNLLGRYSFTAQVPAAGALRPLRDPDAPELDEDEDGGHE